MANRAKLTAEEEQTVRDLFKKGQTREALAVGFGVSYNTIRGILSAPNLDLTENPPVSQEDAGDLATRP